MSNIVPINCTMVSTGMLLRIRLYMYNKWLKSVSQHHFTWSIIYHDRAHIITPLAINSYVSAAVVSWGNKNNYPI